MAGMKQGFITGANAKIKLFGKTMAYATDVSYNATVQTIPIESMGKYEVHANEPVAYMVDGTFSVIRYTSAAAAAANDTAASGNSPSKMGDSTAGDAHDHLNPFDILTAKTFDLEIFQKVSAGTAGDEGAGNTAATDDKAVSKVQDCRLTRRGATLNKRGVLVDNYAFVGIYLHDTDETSGAVGPSGQEDLS